MRRIHLSPMLYGLALALALALASGASALAAPAAGGPAAGADRQSFAETTQVTAVEVPVQVIRDGEPVRGLTADDFELYEGRKKQALTGFDVVDLALPENQRLSAAVPAAGRRHFLLIFDLSNSDPKRILKAREAVKQSLLTTLVPSDLVAVASYGANAGLKLLLGFTSDRRQMWKAVDSLGLADLTDRMHHDPMLLTMSAIADVADFMALDPYDSSAPPMEGATPREQHQYEIHQSIGAGPNPNTVNAGAPITTSYVSMVTLAAAQSLMQQRISLDAMRNAVMALTQSFSELARMMDAVSGRKLVVFFSQGFDGTILQGVDDIGDQQAIANTTMHGLGAFTESDTRYGNTREVNRVEKMLEVFRRSGCVIESVDVGGLRVDQDLDLGASRPSGEAALFQMAHDTGGELFHNFNDLGEAMQRLAKSTSLTYLLTFQPQGPLPPGSYHKIEVRLKNAPRGAQVTYKPGYYAPRPFTQEKPLEKVLAASDQLMSGAAGGSIATAVLAAPFRAGMPAAAVAGGGSGLPGSNAAAPQGAAAATAPPGASVKAYVPVVIEAEGATLLAGAGAAKTVPAEIYAYAVDAQGSIRDYFDQTLQLNVEKAGAQLRLGGLKFFGHLELPPGEYAVRVLLRNGATGAYGKRSTLVTVPAFGGGEPVLLPPLFPEVSGRWTVVRESPRGEQKDASYPFTVGQRAYMPAALPTLRPGESAAVALVGYNLAAAVDGERFEAQAKVQSADGRDLGGGDLSLSGREPGGEGGPDVWKAVFRAPGGLAPGQYRLIVTVKGPRGSQTGTTLFAVAAPGGNAG